MVCLVLLSGGCNLSSSGVTFWFSQQRISQFLHLSRRSPTATFPSKKHMEWEKINVWSLIDVFVLKISCRQKNIFPNIADRAGLTRCLLAFCFDGRAENESAMGVQHDGVWGGHRFPLEHCVGFDISSKDFSLADAMPHLTFDAPVVDWLLLDDAPEPLQCLRHWMIERNNHFATDDYITCWESLVFIVQEDLVESEKLAMVLVFDTYAQELKLFVFRNTNPNLCYFASISSLPASWPSCLCEF